MNGHSQKDGGSAAGASAQWKRGEETWTVERRLLERLLDTLGSPPIGLVLWDGQQIGMADGSAPEVRVQINDRAALYRLLYKPLLTFGELYTAGRIEVSGDLVRAMELIYPGLRKADLHAGALARLARRVLAKRPNPNSLTQSRQNIHAHYDLGNRFYELWLDHDYTQYTCAYYPSPEATLEQAQAAKLEHVCRKLALKPGETVLEAGSGWGGLARYLARHHGVKVRSYNISREQVVYSRQRAETEGLGDAIEYVEDDYRNATGQYDVFVSVGMLEHVGVANYPVLGQVIDRCLKDDGRGLIHSIGQDFSRPLNEWIERYIFPGAYPPTLREMTGIFEPFGFSIVDVENLRPHYAQTLRDWLARYEANVEQVAAMFDAEFVRAWRLYLSGSMAAFTAGQLQLFQVLFQRSGSRALPATRAHLYRDAPEQGAPWR